MSAPDSKKAGQKEDITKLPGVAAVIEHTGKRKHQAPCCNTLREVHERECVAQRIAQRHHECHAHAAKEKNRRKEILRSSCAAQCPEQMDCTERTEKHCRPENKLISEPGDVSHNKQRLHSCYICRGEEQHGICSRVAGLDLFCARLQSC